MESLYCHGDIISGKFFMNWELERPPWENLRMRNGYWNTGKGMKEEVSPRKQCMQSSRESRELLTQKTQKLQLDHRFQLRYTYTKFPFYLQVSIPLFSSPPLFSPFLPSTVSLIRPLSFTFTHTIHLFHRSPEV